MAKPKQIESEKKQPGKCGPEPRMLNSEELTDLAMLSSSCTQSQIADYFGMGARTFAALKERQKEISAIYKRERVKAIGHIAGKLYELIEQGNVTATIFYLKTQAGWRETASSDPANSYEETDGAPPTLLVKFVDADPKKDFEDNLKEVSGTDN